MPRATTTTPVGPLGRPTPAPWTVTETPLGTDFVYGIRRGATGRSIAMTGHEGHANALLIAAAPLLLEALREAVALFSVDFEGGLTGVSDNVGGDWLRQARAAIDAVAGDRS